MVGLMVRMKLRMLRHALHGRRAVAFVLGAVLGLLGGVGTALVTGLDLGDPEVSTDLAAALLAVWTLGWLLGPVVAGGSDETLQPEHFRLLPVTPNALARGLLVAALVGVAPLATTVALLGLVGQGLRWGPAAALVAVLAVLLQLAFAVLLSRVVLAGLGAVLRSRRGRDVGVVLAALVGLAFVPIRLAGETLAPVLLHRESPVFSAVLRALPSGWGAVAVRAAGHGDWVLVAGPLLGLTVLVALLVPAWAALLRVRMTTPPSPASTSGRGRARRGWRGWDHLLPAGPVGAVAAKELRTWWRDTRRRMALISPLVIGLAVPVVTAVSSGGYVNATAFGGLFSLALGCLQAGNLYGFDGTAVWQVLVTPGAERSDVRGRQLAWLVLVGPVVVLVALVLPGVTGAAYAYPWVLGLTPALLGAGAGLVVLLSVYAPYPVPSQRNGNPFASGNNPGCATALRQLAINLLLVAAAVPVLVVDWLGVLVGLPALAWLGVLVGLATGAAMAVWWGRVAHRRLAQRGPELLSTLRAA